MSDLKEKETTTKIMEEVYIGGLNDAWELISKVFSLNRTERKKAFGCEEIRTVVDCFNVKEVLNMLEAYEEEISKIKVGDVVYTDDEPDTYGVVTWENDGFIYVMWNDGSCGKETELDEIHKTDKHIDIQKILEQIAGD